MVILMTIIVSVKRDDWLVMIADTRGTIKKEKKVSERTFEKMFKIKGYDCVIGYTGEDDEIFEFHNELSDEIEKKGPKDAQEIITIADNIRKQSFKKYQLVGYIIGSVNSEKKIIVESHKSGILVKTGKTLSDETFIITGIPEELASNMEYLEDKEIELLDWASKIVLFVTDKIRDIGIEEKCGTQSTLRWVVLTSNGVVYDLYLNFYSPFDSSIDFGSVSLVKDTKFEHTFLRNLKKI